MDTASHKSLLVRVEEASGRTPQDLFAWDTSAGSLEAFVKVELRGGLRNVKAQTTKAPLIGDNITWREELKLEILDGANELRILLCRDKYTGSKRSTSVVAACGIFVSDIVHAVPIDKYFEMFKPNGGGEGGFIRICLDFVNDGAAPVSSTSIPEDSAVVPPTAATVATATPAAATPEKAPGKADKKKKRVVLPVVLSLSAAGAVAAAAAFIVKAAKNR